MTVILSMLVYVVACDQVGPAKQGVCEASALASWATAFGTILLSVVAVWQGKIGSWLFGPRLCIILPEHQGTLVPRGSGVLTWYYHLVVTNSRPRSPAKGCRVTLRRIQRRGPDGRFTDIGVPTALQFVWSHPDVTPSAPTIAIGKTLDLCFVDQGANVLVPALYSYPNNFEGCVKQDQCFRYYLDIEADNFTSREPQLVEIAWNGEWTEDTDGMSHNVTVVKDTK